jgi:hypothetical protein
MNTDETVAAGHAANKGETSEPDLSSDEETCVPVCGKEPLRGHIPTQSVSKPAGITKKRHIEGTKLVRFQRICELRLFLQLARTNIT